jgi:hypothetical protein
MVYYFIYLVERTTPQNLNVNEQPQMNMYPGYQMDPYYMMNYDNRSEYQTNPMFQQFNPYFNQQQVRNPNPMNYNPNTKK